MYLNDVCTYLWLALLQLAQNNSDSTPAVAFALDRLITFSLLAGQEGYRLAADLVNISTIPLTILQL